MLKLPALRTTAALMALLPFAGRRSIVFVAACGHRDPLPADSEELGRHLSAAPVPGTKGEGARRALFA